MKSARARRRTYASVVLATSSLLLIVVMGVSIAAGPRWLLPAELVEMVGGRISGNLESHSAIVWEHRVPRVLLAAVIGASLAVSGLAIQTAVRNPLADPYILGVSSGACAGAVLLLLFGAARFGSGGSLFLAAFVGGMIASAAVYLLAQRRGELVPSRIVLAGVALTYLLTSSISFCLLLIDRNNFGGVNNFLFWAMGSLTRARWDDLALPLAILAACSSYLAFQGRVLDVLNLDDESATALGVRPDVVRFGLFFVVSLLVAASVAVCGQIGFIGLVVPHMARRILGGSHRFDLVLSALLGATFLTLADALARTVASPQEVPVGIVTAGFGAPFFMFLLKWRTSGIAS